MKRGEFYLADLSSRSGSEQRGIRPVIILSHDAFNLTQSWRSIIVISISTSATQANRGPTVVRLPQGAGGLTRESVALCHQITTLDRPKFSQRIGALSSDLLTEVGDAVKRAVDLS